MDFIQAKEILEALADGVNPATGEVLSKYDSCNQVEVVRALHTVLKHLDVTPPRPKSSQPVNAGKPWTAEDEAVLSRMYDSGCSSKEICNQLGRSHGSIAAKLVRLGKINERYEFRSC